MCLVDELVKPVQINEVKEAESFLHLLYENGYLYHPEDDANDVVFSLPICDDARNKLNELMDRVHDLMSDPCEYIMDNLIIEI